MTGIRPICGWPRVFSRRRKSVEVLTLVLGVWVALLCFPTTAAAWWNDEWTLRKKITIDTSPTGSNITDPIGTMPVLVRLHVGNFRFGQAKDDGTDLRFVAEDDKTPLKYHIEKYDSLLGEALVWVNVPDVKPGSKVALWLYYCNKKAVAASDDKGTYDSDTLLVYHFAERGVPPRDSSAWANHAQSSGQTVDGAIIGAGLHLQGTGVATQPASPSLALPDGAPLTWSIWVKPAGPQHSAVIYSRQDGSNAMVIGFDDGAPYLEIRTAANVQRSAPGLPVAPDSWHHLGVIAASGLATIYLDGDVYATLNASLPALNSIAMLGGDSAEAASNGADSATEPNPAQAPAGTSGFTGDIDELEISKVARTAGFIKAMVADQGPEHGKFITYDNDEENASWLSGYFVIILKSVTFDGWVVISLLLVMSAVSWYVMIGKALYVGRQQKANRRFKVFFRQVAGDLSILHHGTEDDVSSLGGRIGAGDRHVLRSSSLYRLYRIGTGEIRSRLVGAAAPKVLSAQSISAIRAALDSGFVTETQQLNDRMVFLTIAISGGPFLGLLGTVVGVMITFAAIAASGEVNVNAIAPGIAAALVATVAGLGVAIPALFGYNYLVTRIKDLSADMHIFLDEFVTRMAEFYDDRPDPRSQRSLAAE